MWEVCMHERIIIPLIVGRAGRNAGPAGARCRPYQCIYCEKIVCMVLDSLVPLHANFNAGDLNDFYKTEFKTHIAEYAQLHMHAVQSWYCILLSYYSDPLCRFK